MCLEELSWAGACASGFRPQLSEWITAVGGKPKPGWEILGAAQQFKNIPKLWNVEESKLLLRESACCTVEIIFVSFIRLVHLLSQRSHLLSKVVVLSTWSHLAGCGVSDNKNLVNGKKGGGGEPGVGELASYAPSIPPLIKRRAICSQPAPASTYCIEPQPAESHVWGVPGINLSHGPHFLWDTHTVLHKEEQAVTDGTFPYAYIGLTWPFQSTGASNLTVRL